MRSTVVIVNWNTKELLKACLRSIYQESAKTVQEVIVVDNDSTDGSQALVRQEFSQARLIENEDNRGFSYACNQGIRASRSEYVIILNSDTLVSSGSIDSMTDFMDKNDRVGVLGPKLLNEDGSVQLSCRNFPSFKEATGHAFLGIFSQANPYTRSYRQMDWDHQTACEVDWVSGACMILRRKALDEIGLFDESYFMYLEDVDLCRRMKESGWKVYFYPEAVVTHLSGGSSKQRSGQAIIEHQKSIYHFYRQYYPQAKHWYWRWLVAFGLIVRGAILLLVNTVRRVKARLS